MWISQLTRITPQSIDPSVRNYHWLDMDMARREACDGTTGPTIESMLRRMRDEDDCGAQFYLFRVALRQDGLIIGGGLA